MSEINLFQEVPYGAMRGQLFGNSEHKVYSRVCADSEGLIPGRGVFTYKGDSSTAGNAKLDKRTLTLAGTATDEVWTVEVNGGVDDLSPLTFIQAGDDREEMMEALVIQMNNEGTIIAEKTSATVMTVIAKYKTITMTFASTGDVTATVGTASASDLQVYIGAVAKIADDNQDGDYADLVQDGDNVNVLNAGSMYVEVDALSGTPMGGAIKVSTLPADRGIFKASTESSNVRTVPNAFYGDEIENPLGQVAIANFVGGVV